MSLVNQAPTAHNIRWLMLSLSMAAAPHFIYQPIWVMAFFIVGMAWRGMNMWLDWPLPSSKRWGLRLIQFGLAAIALVIVILQYGNTIGRDAGVAFLVIMLAFKVTEIHNRRDYYVGVFLGFFVVITNFFFSQSIPMLLFMLAVVVMLTSCLISINSSQAHHNSFHTLKLSANMLLQSMPIMLILFVLFPRIAGPLWGVPHDAHVGKTGMSDEMTLGRISNLIQSDEVAFRVQFDGDIPPSAARYWRGPVLWQTDGRTWTELDDNLVQSAQPNITTTGQAYDYSLVLEPHNNHWLFALDFPSTAPTDIRAYLSLDGQLTSVKEVNQRQRYSLRSYPDYQFNDEANTLHRIALSLPDGLHPRTQALANDWINEAPDKNSYIQRVLTHFNQADFYYTLSPPLLGGDTVDSFMFESKRGFCEHYAASFTVMMRAAGIPARIVTGYQGGEINPVNGELVVRQRDAHAWTEVWLDGQGWVRVDPTAAVASERIELGINEIMPASMRAPILVARSDLMISVWEVMRNNWDALNSQWNLWVLSYGPERQKEFLAKLGMKNPDWQKMAIWLGSLIGVMFILFPLFLFYRRKHTDPVQQAYLSFCERLADKGLSRLPHEGPVAFSQRACELFPEDALEIQRLTQAYIDLIYGKQTNTVAGFIQRVKGFRLSL